MVLVRLKSVKVSFIILIVEYSSYICHWKLRIVRIGSCRGILPDSRMFSVWKWDNFFIVFADNKHQMPRLSPERVEWHRHLDLVEIENLYLQWKWESSRWRQPVCPAVRHLCPRPGFFSNHVQNRLYCFCNVYKLSIFEVLKSFKLFLWWLHQPSSLRIWPLFACF